MDLRNIKDRLGKKNDTYVCLDDLKSLESKSQLNNRLNCANIGITKINEDGKNTLQQFDDYLQKLKVKRDSIVGIKWSDALAYSASMFVKQMEGCSIYANQLWKDGHQDDHLKKIATFTEHKRFAIYPD